jgi:hypothetical protein
MKTAGIPAVVFIDEHTIGSAAPGGMLDAMTRCMKFKNRNIGR